MIGDGHMGCMRLRMTWERVLRCVERDNPDLGIVWDRCDSGGWWQTTALVTMAGDRQRWKCRAGLSHFDTNLKCLSVKICTQKGSLRNLQGWDALKEMT